MCINPESWCATCPDQERCFYERKSEESDGCQGGVQMFKLQDLPEWQREVLSKLQR